MTAPPPGRDGSALAELLRRDKETIIREWEKRVLSDPSVPEAQRLPEPILRDHMPGFIDLLAKGLDASNDQPESRYRSLGEGPIAQVHARHRFAEHYSLRSTMREWSHFRSTLVDVVFAPNNVGWAELKRVQLVIEAAVETSAVEMCEADLESRSKAEAERDRSVALLDSLMRTVPIGLAFADRHLRYVRVNETLAQMSGIPPELLEGRSIWDIVPADIARVIAPHINHVFETNRAQPDVTLSGPTRVGGTDVRHFLASFYPVRKPTGEVLVVGCVVIDVTDREQNAERLRQTIRFRDRFMAILGHDLSAHVAAMTMSATLIRQRHPAGELGEAARDMERSGRRVTEMLRDLLDLARVQLGEGIPVFPHLTSLERLAQHTIDELRLIHPNRGVTLVARGDCNGLWDPERITQIVWNLLVNAFAHSPPDRDVRVRLDGTGRTVCVSVTNHGPPIPSQVQRNIFDPFAHHSARSPKNGRLGLGLFIVKEVAEAHGGSVKFQSDAESTTFTVELPRRVTSVGRRNRPGALSAETH
ncbi:MAG: PAS domain-containing protein [Polyangiaceae bacterium]|nr:PAS domain-containing protein [Polyangiaceae bacterium]